MKRRCYIAQLAVGLDVFGYTIVDIRGGEYDEALAPRPKVYATYPEARDAALSMGYEVVKP
jgi:hypothetical protein